MSKHDENQKDNQELERNINSYFKKKIEGASKQYKKKYFQQKELVDPFGDINQAKTVDEDIMQSIFKSELSKELSR